MTSSKVLAVRGWPCSACSPARKVASSASAEESWPVPGTPATSCRNRTGNRRRTASRTAAAATGNADPSLTRPATTSVGRLWKAPRRAAPLSLAFWVAVMPHRRPAAHSGTGNKVLLRRLGSSNLASWRHKGEVPLIASSWPGAQSLDLEDLMAELRARVSAARWSEDRLSELRDAVVAVSAAAEGSNAGGV